MSLQQHDVVPGEQYRYALTNFRIAHEKVEEQRRQLEEQERQVALLRARIATLEGGSDFGQKHANANKQGGSSVDDFSIKNSASKLERLINRWSADLTRKAPVALDVLHRSVLSDITETDDPQLPPTSMRVQSLLRHAMSETISEGIINCLIVTDSSEANIQLARIHEHLFARDPTVAGVWRRQTFSAAVETCSQETLSQILVDQLPSLTDILREQNDEVVGLSLLESAYEFSRMLHGSHSSSGGTIDAFYRSFVPELGSPLYPQQVELIKRCVKSERGEIDHVGATVFPGLVKVTRGPSSPGGRNPDTAQTVVRRAQVICECALNATAQGAAPGTAA